MWCSLRITSFLTISFVWISASFQPLPKPAALWRQLHSTGAPKNAARLPRNKHFPLHGGSRENLSSADRERRDEEKRRNDRKDEVIIGRTSARRGESDYALDPKATEEEYLRQASKEEQEVFYSTERGMELLNSLKLDEAEKEFDKVFTIRPNAYLWQAGIVKFYLGRIQEAADVFARNARTYETKFGQPASEERIWRDACELKFLKSMSPSKRKKLLEETSDIAALIKPIPDFASDDVFSTETRKVMKLTRDLFGATVHSDMNNEILARAKLRSLCGSEDKHPTPDRKMWKLNAWFYLGLHLDVNGDVEESKRCMKMALKMCPSSGKSDDIVHTLPLLHMSARDWFDDSEFDEDPMIDDYSTEDVEFAPQKPNLASYAYADPFIEKSIKNGVQKMKFEQLKEALRLRGLKTVGSKQVLQERLFYSLMDDSGFHSGFAP
eukprot:scaffold2243_cov122-Cylindrotheca_fusiformis.AAC.24